jgi:hypothetical protein
VPALGFAPARGLVIADLGAADECVQRRRGSPADLQVTDYHHAMYLDALSFLQDEREAFRPYEALLDLTDEQLDRPVEAAGGWSGRDLMGHIVLWQEAALATAKDLAVGEASPTMERIEAQWAAGGDQVNEDGLARFRAMSMDEVRAAFRSTSGELRGYLTVVPEARWIKHASHQEYFFGEMTEHYEEHAKELRAILEAARG